MAELARPVGLGLASRGDVGEAVAWAERARDRGLTSVWFHDSYFERDAVTYASAVAAQVGGLRVGLGALNPFTRHPVVLAMTVSAIDEMAPGRVALGLGTGLPLRLGQMGIPYTPDDGLARVGDTIDSLRTLWRGERIPAGVEGFPPVEPMFAPPHRVPIYVAGYRSAMVELAGRKADGYLARPAESLPSLTGIVARLRNAVAAAGRPAGDVEVSGYLLSLVAETRREALNRAKREPFVIYMLSIQTDVALRRAGFEQELRDRVAAAWRAEEYHRAAALIPDDLLDAFLLCGTVEDVAAQMCAYHDAGMDVPLIQPVVQDSDQVDRALQTACRYAGETAAAAEPVTARAAAAASAAAGPSDAPVAAPSNAPAAGSRLRRRAAGSWEIARPFSLTASIVPVAAGGALAAATGVANWALFAAAFAAAVLLQVGTNVVNEVYDVRAGVDAITTPRASHAILTGRIGERAALGLAVGAFLAAAGIGVWLVVARGWVIAALGLLGLLGGFQYTAPPLQYKYRALGLPAVFVLMGPLMVGGAYYVAAGTFAWVAVVVGLPIGLLVAAILHANEWRDIADDARAGISTLSIRYGRRVAYLGYLSLVLGAYVVVVAAVMAGLLPDTTLLAVLSLPLMVRVVRASTLGAQGQQRAIAFIDVQTALLHAVFGVLLTGGLAWAAL